MAATTDLNLLTSLTATVEACSDPSVATPDVDLQKGITAAANRGQAAAAGLSSRSASVVDDRTQNVAAAKSADEAAEWAVEEYGVLRRHAEALVPVRQSEQVALGRGELAKRRAFVATHFRDTVSDLKNVGRRAALTRLRELRVGVLESAYAHHFDLEPFLAQLETFETRMKTLSDEELDDAPLLQALNEARAEATRAYRGLRLILEGALVLENNPIPLNDFIVRQVSKRRPDEAPGVAAALDSEPIEDAEVLSN